ncbi:MAG: Uma2 family endonuclease [Cyanophyceae cyanobacterium]
MTIAKPSTQLTKPSILGLNVQNVALKVTSEQFDQLCLDNPDLRLELTRTGELIVMAPAGGESSEKNFELAMEVGLWNRRTGLGRAFDSSCGYDFTALGGGKLSPDVSWIARSRLEGVNLIGFIPVVPDFVIELRSATDGLKRLQEKMREYQRLGVKLGLLIDPQGRRVEVYRPQREMMTLESPNGVDCGDVMPGFVLNLERIWP